MTQREFSAAYQKALADGTRQAGDGKVIVGDKGERAYPCEANAAMLANGIPAVDELFPDVPRPRWFGHIEAEFVERKPGIREAIYHVRGPLTHYHGAD